MSEKMCLKGAEFDRWQSEQNRFVDSAPTVVNQAGKNFNLE